MKLRLKYLVEDVDRHGNVRCYVRVKGRPKIRIREAPGTEGFMTAYQAALAGQRLEPRLARLTRRGSFRHLSQLYYASSEFKALDAATQLWRRRVLDDMARKHGEKPVAMMELRHVRKIRDENDATPAAANKRLKALRALFSWGVEAEEVEHDPTQGVRFIKYATVGHHSWTIEEVQQFEAAHAVGTRPRLAMSLLLYTACRREDAVRLGPQHVRNARLKYTQAKNEHRNPVQMDIPLHDDLAAVIAATPSGHMTFLVTKQGKPFAPAGFGNWFRDQCDQAGLPHCSAHGLRKAAAARLAERGATAHEIMAITGHQTLEEVERYTRAAQKSKLADSAMEKLKG